MRPEVRLRPMTPEQNEVLDPIALLMLSILDRYGPLTEKDWFALVCTPESLRPTPEEFREHGLHTKES